MRDEGVIYVAGHPVLNRRLPGCIRLRNDLYCVEWGVKLYSLTVFYNIFSSIKLQNSRLTVDEVSSCVEIVGTLILNVLIINTNLRAFI